MPDPRIPGPDLTRLLTASEPEELRQHFFVPTEGRVLHSGTTVPVIGMHTRTASGLWVPSSARLGQAPIDHIGVYITFKDLAGARVPFEALAANVGRYSRTQLLVACANVLRRLHDDSRWADEAAREAVRVLRGDLAARLQGLLTSGRQLFTRQGVLALAKMATVHGGAETTSEVPLDASFALLIAAVHDHLGGRADESNEPIEMFGGLPAKLSASVAANQWFNRSFDEANFLTMADRRWNNPNRASVAQIREQFKAAMGFDMEDQNQVALALWASSRSGNVMFGRSYLDSLPLSGEVVGAVLAHLSRPVAEMQSLIDQGELEEASFEWNYDTFEQFPIVGLESGEYLVLEPSYLLRRCLGWAPLYDLQSTRANHDMALSTEDYARDVLEAIYGGGPARRLFHEDELKLLAPGAKCADAAVDFGHSWAIFEVTARRPLRKLIHGVDPSSLTSQVEVVLEEVLQIAGSARVISEKGHELTGTAEQATTRMYPVVVMTEGFPTNPIMLTAIRGAVEEQGCFEGLNVAPVEVIDLVELEMVEAIAESGGPALPQLLEEKMASNYWADSLRNYLISRPDVDLTRSVRVSDTFAQPLKRLADRLMEREAAAASTDAEGDLPD